MPEHRVFDQIQGKTCFIEKPPTIEIAKRQMESAKRRMASQQLREDVRRLAALDLKHWRKIFMQQQTKNTI